MNHHVDYYHVGGFTKTCPWGCGAKYLQSEWDRLAKPRADGTIEQGLMSKCCKNGKVDTEYMRRVVERLDNPPPFVKVRSTLFPPLLSRLTPPRCRS